MLSHNPIPYAITKHIEIDNNFIRERVTARKLRTQHQPESTQVVDAMTKYLLTTIFWYFRTKLKLVSLTQS